jgi:lysophospholipase L1-like esterase
MKRLSFLAILFSSVLLHAQEAPSAAKPKGPARWEAEIAKMETRLKENPPAPGGVVFAGSSSIRLWDLKKSFPDLPLVNTGFGGSIIEDATHFAPRLILPLKPRLIVFYSGDNDSSAGHSAARISEDFKTFATTIHTALPDCRILYIPIKPSIARQKLLPLQREANALIEKHCASQPGKLQYVDFATPLLAPDGSLRAEVYQKDGLHLSPAGYEIWNKLLRPYLEKP